MIESQTERNVFLVMSEPLVEIKQGRLRGKIDRNQNGNKYYTFHSIPYAKPPLGELRFKAPQPPEPWEGIRDATIEGDESFSRHLVFGNIVGSEDCLTLNVYTPNLPSSNGTLKPVMFWIHGGGYTSGSSKTEVYGPEFFMCEDIVLVTINYRLGVFGFLSSDNPNLGIPGNAGLKDMVMALKWVQANIKQFCGDPNNVTIFGESAGGASVHYLILSPMAKNLFHRAIIQSGSALNVWACGSKMVLELAKHLGKETTSEEEALNVLMQASTENLLKAQEGCLDPVHACDVRPHGPVVEKCTNQDATFLPDYPINIIKSGNYNNVPLIIGFTSHEGMLYAIMEKRRNVSLLITDFENAIPFTLQIPRGTPKSLQLADKIKNFYYGNEEPSSANRSTYYNLQSDNFFFREIYRSVKMHLDTSVMPIYFYKISVESTLNMYKMLGDIKEKGVCHGDDVSYMFKCLLTPNIVQNSVEDRSVRRFIKFWTNFARTGNPNPDEMDDLINVHWPKTSLEHLEYLEINDELSVQTKPEPERMTFWEDVFANYSSNCKL